MNGFLEENELGKSYKLPNGDLHREDGPAYIAKGGYKSWWINGKLHRLDGPARIWPISNGEIRCQWWINNEHTNYKTQEEFNRLLKMKAFW